MLFYNSFSASTIPEPDINVVDDRVNVDEFWHQIRQEIVARGFISGNFASSIGSIRIEIHIFAYKLKIEFFLTFRLA